jgi:hypothetical protein
MTQHKERRPKKLTDDERHIRFLDMATKVGASAKKEDFERSLAKIISCRASKQKGQLK